MDPSLLLGLVPNPSRLILAMANISHSSLKEHLQDVGAQALPLAGGDPNLPQVLAGSAVGL